jgi:hypothetical protein
MLQIATKLAQSRGKAYNRLAAMDRVIRMGERRAKLTGLEVEKHEHEHNHAVRIYHGVEEYENDTQGITVEAVPLLDGGNNQNGD